MAAETQTYKQQRKKKNITHNIKHKTSVHGKDYVKSFN